MAGCNAPFCAVAACHPSFLTIEDIQSLKVPVCLLPSKDESPEHEEMGRILMKEKDNASQNVYKRFEDMHHGWVAARGDFSNEKNAERATEAITILQAFFKENFERK